VAQAELLPHQVATPFTHLHLAVLLPHKENKMEKLQISAQLLNSLIGYLGTRPYQEVFQLVEALQAEAKNQPEKAPE
jgi:hypothetical protein